MSFRTELIDSACGSEAANSSVVGPLASTEVIFGASSAIPSLWGQETILLVEDEAFVRKATAEALESAGYRVLTAESASSALQARCEYSEQVDLLLADVVMPGGNGYELAAEFKFLYPEIRILLMSGYAEQPASLEPSPYRKQYMPKPFSVPTLLKRVREVLD
ncbi:MAG: response regulator, partial [Candidatus Sulfotelmatobacter sp.]